MSSASRICWSRTPDQVHDRLEIELSGKSGADLVDQHELRRALIGLAQEALGLVEEPSVLQCHAHARRDRADSRRSSLSVKASRRSSESATTPIGLVPGHDRDAQPGLAHGRLEAFVVVRSKEAAMGCGFSG